MKVVLCLFAIFSYCLTDPVEILRNHDPAENDGDFIRFIYMKNSEGVVELVDLLDDTITATAAVSDVTYYLYTRSNPNNPHVITNGDVSQLSGSSFNSAKRNLFLIHGWVDNYQGALGTLATAAALKAYDINVIVVDWSPIASKNYITAKNAVTSIGPFVGQFINGIVSSYGQDGSKFILAGHSLGAHIAGNAGAVTTVLLDHIIGLDPASPLFDLSQTNNRLDKSDADYVQIIHTNGNLLGISSSIGDVDFYPNGGQTQAGCGLDLLGTCSHNRVNELIAEAIEFEDKFLATSCGSYKDYTAGKCNNNRKAFMAEIDVDKTVTGDYYLTTNGDSPYALVY